MNPPTLTDVYAARPRVARVVRPSPLMRHPLLSLETGLDIQVKHENHNPTGAFKVRGGVNLIASRRLAITGSRSRWPVSAKACRAPSSCRSATTRRRTRRCAHSAPS
jgi:threonine dehydratase